MASWTIKFKTLICKIKKKNQNFQNAVMFAHKKICCKYGKVANYRKWLGV